MRNHIALGVICLLALPTCTQKGEQAEGQESTAAAQVEPPSNAPAKPPADPALVKRGAYLADMMMCGICHTPMGDTGPDLSKAFAGGFEVAEVFGTWRSPNITQDKKTGIGDWTDEQILAGIREGKRPDGSLMYPIMPYMFFNVLSDEDGKALTAFLRTLPAVTNAVQGNTDLKLPKVPAPPPKGTAPAKDDHVKYGEYLSGLMHCALCHTPMDKKGQPNMKKVWAGGFPMEIPKAFEKMMGTGIIYSANITSHRKTGIGKWSEKQILESFTSGKRPDGTAIQGPMGMFTMAVFPKLTLEDRTSLAKFVKKIPAIKNKVPKGSFKPAPPPPSHASADDGTK